jgi:hypothetical protein
LVAGSPISLCPSLVLSKPNESQPGRRNYASN